MAFYTPANFLPDCSLGYLVRRCHQLGLIAMEPVFSRHGLSGMQWSALVAVLVGRATTSAELAREISYDPGATTRLVDGLEANGWMTRTRDGARGGDRRVIKLALTDAGADLAQAVRLDVIDLWNGWLGDWDEGEIVLLVAQLHRLRDRLEAATMAEMTA
jgi:DNA-binding MarR family transcriptional regulator